MPMSHLGLWPLSYTWQGASREFKQRGDIIRMLFFLKITDTDIGKEHWKYRVMGSDVIYDHLNSGNAKFGVISMWTHTHSSYNQRNE